MLKVAAAAFAAAIFFLFTALQAYNYNPVDALVDGYQNPRPKARVSLLASFRKLGALVSRVPMVRDLVVAERIERRLYLAGYGIGAYEWFGIMTLSAALGGFVGAAAWGGRLLPFAFACLFPVMGLIVPKALLDGKAERVLLETGIEFIGVAEKVSLLCSAGVSIVAALDSCKSDTFMGREIGLMMQSVVSGTPLEKAVDAFAKRIGLPEANTFARSVKNAQAYGQERLPGVLRKLVADIRHSRESRVEEIARKMESKLIFPVVGSILPAVFLVVIGPVAFVVLRILS